MKALIFGANGQDGFYLNSLLQSRGIESIGLSRSGEWQRCDVANREEVETLVALHQPTYIFHLAANSTTRHDAVMENHATIATGTLNLLEAVKKSSPRTKVFIAGSGLQLENRSEPVSEFSPFVGDSPYAVARIHSVYAARYYRTLGIQAYVGYLFHHESPLRKPNHVSQLIALAAQRIAAGSDEILELGDISVSKEWTFAGDVVQGILTLVEQDRVFEATVGSGAAYSIEYWLQLCFGLSGKNWQDHVRLRVGFTPEYTRLVSDSSTIFSLGWQPSVDIQSLSAMMVLGEKRSQPHAR